MLIIYIYLKTVVKLCYMNWQLVKLYAMKIKCKTFVIPLSNFQNVFTVSCPFLGKWPILSSTVEGTHWTDWHPIWYMYVDSSGNVHNICRLKRICPTIPQGGIGGGGGRRSIIIKTGKCGTKGWTDWE